MTQRCWPRAELGHPALLIILQYSRSGTSSKFRGSVEGGILSPSGLLGVLLGNNSHLFNLVLARVADSLG